jgi:hypothetical protein
MKNLSFFFIGLIMLACNLGVFAGSVPKFSAPQGFIENKGQVHDQEHRPRKDILFSTSDGQLVYHFHKGGISYQIGTVKSHKKETDFKLKYLNETERLVPDKINLYRLDIEWIGANNNPKIITDEQLTGISHFYSQSCPGGAINVRSFTGIVYKNLYSGIDLHYYFKEGHLKYDYLVAPNADHGQIKIKVKGCAGIELQQDGSLLLKTPIGEIREAAPLVYQQGRRLNARWVLDGNELSFEVIGRNFSLPMIIDPLVRSWGTYFGASLSDEGRGCATDASGNIYLTGKTNSGTSIATSGSYQTTLSGVADAFLAKFNDQGVLLWATYYGGSGDEAANACATDASGNCYVVGTTSASSSGIASAGTGHQGFNAGGLDGMIVKFSTTGLRVWGSYYGGSGGDHVLSVTVNGNDLYICGHTGSAGSGFPANAIATAGAHQTTYGTGFLVKFNLNGTRQWGTYYGDGVYDPANCVTTDLSGNVYVAGQTYASTNIATAGAHQTTMNGMYDGYLVKFSSAGVRQWGTYYGDISLEGFSGVTTDASGNVYAVGGTGSPVNIATPGAHQTVIGMQFNGDGMVIKFNSAGVRLWGTYYGGNTDDLVTSCMIAPSGDLFFAGISNSPAGIATSDGTQPNLSSQDAFLAHFNQAGQRQWATYYGSTGTEKAMACAAGPGGKIYMCGFGAAAAILSTQGSHQSTFGGGASDAFLAQFEPCSAPAAPVNVTAASNQTICANSSATVNATGTGTLSWSSEPVAGSAIGTGTMFTTPALSAGTHTFYAMSTNSCSANSPFTPVTVTVISAPVLSITATKTLICPGETTTLTATGASTYTWSAVNQTPVLTITPTTSGVYTVVGASLQHCTSSKTIEVTMATCSSLGDINTKVASIFPNPFKEHLTIKHNGFAEIEIYSVLGQQLFKHRISGDTVIDLSTCQPGMYFLVLQSEEGSFTYRIVKD